MVAPGVKAEMVRATTTSRLRDSNALTVREGGQTSRRTALVVRSSEDQCKKNPGQKKTKTDILVLRVDTHLVNASPVEQLLRLRRRLNK